MGKKDFCYWMSFSVHSHMVWGLVSRFWEYFFPTPIHTVADFILPEAASNSTKRWVTGFMLGIGALGILGGVGYGTYRVYNDDSVDEAGNERVTRSVRRFVTGEEKKSWFGRHWIKLLVVLIMLVIMAVTAYFQWSCILACFKGDERDM